MNLKDMKIGQSILITAVPLLSGKVRYFEPKNLKGVIEGKDGNLYDIQLAEFGKFKEQHKQWANKIKNGMPIKFKIIDPDDSLVEIGDWSF